MAQRLIRHVRSQLIAYLALFVALGGTSIAAVEALPRNSVGSPQIKNRSIQTVDVSRRAVSALRGRRGLRGAQGLPGAKGDKGDKGDTGAQGPVGPTFGRFGDVFTGCDPSSTAFVTCAATDPISLPAAGRVLLIGAASWSDQGDAPPNSGSCQLTVDGTRVGQIPQFGEATATHTAVQSAGSVSTTAVTEPLPAGVHTFAFECNETQPQVFVLSATLSVVLLGTS
jgi:hypothetical protein